MMMAPCPIQDNGTGFPHARAEELFGQDRGRAVRFQIGRVDHDRLMHGTLGGHARDTLNLKTERTVSDYIAAPWVLRMRVERHLDMSPLIAERSSAPARQPSAATDRHVPGGHFT